MKEDKLRVIYIIDLDHTLVNVETVSNFLDFLGYQRLLSIIKPFLIFLQILTLLFLRLFKAGIDFSKYLKLRMCLRNLDKALIDMFAHRYAKTLLDYNLVNKQVLKFLSRACENNLTILLTASVSPIANCFQDLGFKKVYSSEIVYRNRRFHRLQDLYGRKHIIVKSLLNLRNVSKVIIIDDSPEKEIIEIAKKDQRIKIISPHALKANMETEIV